jgi:myo-inositol 2-dehydrogenase/D-chiro-inositol 1-dehydrogenase
MTGIALIGAGRIGRIHAANAVAEPRLRLRYVVDPFAQAADELADASGASATTIEHVLDDADVAGIIVASSTDTHLDFAVRAIEAGKAVFCEKPIDLDLARARAAGAILDQPGARLFLGFNRRFDPHFGQLKAKLDSVERGTLETLHIISHDPAPPPIDYVRVSGGLFRDMAIHDFDMARWLLGEEPVEVYAAGACLIDPAIGAAGDVDTAKTMLRTRSGKLCVISNSRRSAYGYDQRIEAYCSDGLIRAGNLPETTVETWSSEGSDRGPFRNFFLDRYADAYRAEMRHFADMIVDGASSLVGYRDGIAALALAEAADNSAESGQVVPC